MNICKDCGVQFQPLPNKEWATQCFECWKKAKNQVAKPQNTLNSASKGSSSSEKHIIRQNVLARACEFALAGKIELAEGDNVMVKLFELAERLEAWILRD